MNIFKRTPEQKAVAEQKKQERADRRAAANANFKARRTAIDDRYAADKAAVETARAENKAAFKAAIGANTDRFHQKLDSIEQLHADNQS